MALFKSLTFGNVNSLDYGVYITGAGVYNAPERAVEMYAIPGRNGALAIDGGRYENIEVTYNCGCFASTDAEFSEKIRAFRNAVCSQYSYTRLTDEYNPDEYRMALYHSGLEAEPFRSKAGTFEITFDCKPQRFLTSGESTYQIGEWGQTITETGDIVTYQGDDLTAVKSLTTDMEPIQDLHGFDSPWPAGGGKNLLPPMVDGTYTGNGVTAVVKDGVATLSGTTTASGNAFIIPLAESFVVPSGCYYHVGNSIANTSFAPAVENGNNTSENINLSCSPVNRISAEMTTRVGQTYTRIRFYIGNNVTISGTYSPMMCLDSTAKPYTPYSNICPIYERTGQTVYVSQTTSTSDADVYTSDFVDSQGNTLTVYGGEDEIVVGVLTKTMNRFDPSDATSTNFGTTASGVPYLDFWLVSSIRSVDNSFAISTGYERISVNIAGRSGTFKNYGVALTVYDSRFTSKEQALELLGSEGFMCVYTLETPQTYQLTPTEVTTLIGTNNVWSDDGEVTVEYGTDPYTMINDTQFASKPLIKVTGYGEIGFGDITITITGTAGVVTYIDCDLMECYRMSGGAIVPANQYVTFTGTDFPTIPTGKTRVTSASTISKVEVVPRWWII